MRFTVTYQTLAQLAAEHEEQMTRGGLLVRGPAPAGLALFATVELELDGAFLPAPLVLPAQVVQVVAGVGVALAFDAHPVAAALAALEAAPLGAAPAPPAAEPAPPAPAPSPPAAAQAAEGRSPPVRNELAAKIQQALHGSKDERTRILRDPNRMLHPYVLKNPHLGLDEVLALAKMTALSPEVLAQVAERPEWARRPEIALALVRNPKLPTPLAVRLLDHVSPADLRQLAKDQNTRGAVQQAARKKVIT